MAVGPYNTNPPVDQRAPMDTTTAERRSLRNKAEAASPKHTHVKSGQSRDSVLDDHMARRPNAGPGPMPQQPVTGGPRMRG